jgi:hypothetical protein
MKRDVTRLSFLGAALLFASSVANAQCAGTGGPGTVIPQIVDGGAWVTTIVLTNPSSIQETINLVFFQDAGGGVTQPWVLNFVEMTSAQAQPLTVAPGSTLFLHTLGTAVDATVGWGLLSAYAGCGSVAVSGYAISTRRIPGRTDQEATGQAAPVASRYLVPFDNTGGSVTTVAIVNPNMTPQETISIGIRTSDGIVSQEPAITLPLGGHASFSFPVQFPATAGKTGLAEFYNYPEGFSILALHFSSGAFTTAPVYSVAGSPIIVSAP